MIVAQPSDALALAAPAFRMSYGHLNRYSALLAEALQMLGVGTGTPIGVFANRTPAGVVGALAVLKAGGCYIPLDPANPPERLDYILRDTSPPFVLAERDIANRLPKGKWKVIPLDDAPPSFSEPHEPRAQVAAPVPDSLACIVYISGPKGHPLGVEITHAGLLNLIRWHQRAFQVSAADNASQIAAPGSDAAVWEVWPYLTAGASLYFPDERSRRSAPLLRDWLADEFITVAFAPAALSGQLMALDWPCTTALRCLLTSGNELRQQPPARLPFAVMGTYGATEATAVAASWMVAPCSTPGEFPTIGHRIDNARLMILNESSEAVPDGLPGELCIGGPGVARGYWNQPELTAAKFASDPSGADPRARLFRTGELARRLPDGHIALLGRLDDQICVRGCRVEPAEVEAALSAHPEVAGSAAVIRHDLPGGPLLVAYVKPLGDDAPSPAAIQEWLRDRLPEYMVPAAIISLRELPLTPCGKLDRTSLRRASPAVSMLDSVLERAGLSAN